MLYRLVAVVSKSPLVFANKSIPIFVNVRYHHRLKHSAVKPCSVGPTNVRDVVVSTFTLSIWGRRPFKYAVLTLGVNALPHELEHISPFVASELC